MKGKASSQQPTIYMGYPAQTSLYGIPIKIVYGQNRISGDVIWTGNWQANPVSGGKSSKGGKGGDQYDYKTSILIALCEGPINGILGVYVDKTIYAISSNTIQETVSASLKVAPTISGGAFGTNLTVGMVQNFNVTVNDFGSYGNNNLIGTQVVPLEYVSSNPGPGQYTIDTTDPNNPLYVFNAAQQGQNVYISYTFTDINSSIDSVNNPSFITSFGFDFINGEQGQEPWGYLPTGQNIGYTGVALLANQQLDLGSSGTISNYSFEVAGLEQSAPNGMDCDPYNVIFDFLTNSLYGVGLNTSEIGDPNLLTTVNGNSGGKGISFYTQAYGIFISPIITSQKAARDWLGDWLKISNTEAVWSDGILKFRPYGDTSQVGNGVIYIPDTQPIYDIDDDHYIAGSGDEPITVDRPSVRDADNDIKVEWANRANQYTHETLQEVDDLSIRLYGRRSASPLSYDCITTQSVAQTVAITQLRRSVYIRNQYQFKLGAAFALLEPMDVITITDINLGLGGIATTDLVDYPDGVMGTPVRIIEIGEDEDGTFSITAEEFPWSSASPTLFPKQVRAPYGPGYFATPGSVNQPGFIEIPEEVAQGSPYQVGIALSGGQNWGGCDVYMSTDGVNWSTNSLGKFLGPSTMGVLTAPLLAVADPDNTSTLAVNLTESTSQLVSYTQDQKDNFVSLLAIDDEIISYELATPTSTYGYNITKLRRGVYGTPISNHATGAVVFSLNDTLFEYDYDPSVMGSTVYFKFTSFNTAGQNEELIANVAAYPFYIEGPRLPYPWNQGTLGTAPSTGQTILNYSRFKIQQSYETNTDGSQEAYLTIGPAGIPVNTISTSTPLPNVVLNTGNTGGTIPGGATYIVGVVVNPTTAPQMVRSAISVPSGTNTNLISVQVIFATPATDTADIFITSDFDFGWTLVGTITASTTLGMTATVVDTVTKSASLLVAGHSCTTTITGADPNTSIKRNGVSVGTTSGTGTFDYSFTASGSGSIGEVWTTTTQSALLTYEVATTTMTACVLDTINNTSSIVGSGHTFITTISGAPANKVVNAVLGSYSNQIGTTNANGVLTVSSTEADLPAIENWVFTCGSDTAYLEYQVTALTSKPRSMVITAVGQMKDNQIVDEYFDHLTITATSEAHAGIFGGQIYSIASNGDGTCTVTFSGTSFSTGQLNGRILSLIGSYADVSPQNIIDTPIISNTATTVIIADMVSPTQVLFPGDVVVVRTQVTSATATTITDSNWVNGGDPNHNTGLAPHAEKGNLVYIIKGTGTGQAPRPILDNDTINATVSVPFYPIPDTTSIFVILNPNVQFSQDTNSFPNNTNTQVATFNFPIQNLTGETYFIQLFSISATGTSSLFGYSPFREVYIFGSGGERTIVATAGGTSTTFTQLNTDGHVYCDSTLNNINFNLLPDSQQIGRLLLIEKKSTDTNTIDINAYTGDDFTGGGDNGATTIQLKNAGDNAFLKF